MTEVNLEVWESELDELEQAFNAVFVEGKSYSQAGRELALTPNTVKKRAYKYRELLKHMRSESDKEDFLAEYEAQLQRALQQSDKVIKQTEAKGQVLAMVGAINAKSTILDKIMRVRGLEAPKEDKTKLEGRLEIVWGDESDEEPTNAGTE